MDSKLNQLSYKISDASDVPISLPWSDWKDIFGAMDIARLSIEEQLGTNNPSANTLRLIKSKIIEQLPTE